MVSLQFQGGQRAARSFHVLRLLPAREGHSEAVSGSPRFVLHYVGKRAGEAAVRGPDFADR